ncbi:ABC transporter ATP-binding protein [Arthrobacter methylotrophus]|uniref:ABC transporter ATP-binding protein n=1 Tax=Arthrobacter methylotrophus TaxID=121291 RepID=A0ABV5UVH9_9MICC
MSAPVLELRGVSKSYTGGVKALDSVDLELGEGEMLGIVGPSGSGKSTLLNVMGTLDRASEGEVLVGGMDVSTFSDRLLSTVRAQAIGFVFQQFHLNDTYNALQNVAVGLQYAKVPRRDRQAIATAALETVRMGHRLDHQPHQLSGGEKQRVAIARALVNKPKYLLADEPTGALDSENGAAVMELFGELNQQGMTVVIITHDLEIADSLPRRVEIRDGVLRAGATRKASAR